MASYPIKMMKDENNKPFVPLVSTEGIKNPQGQTLDSLLNTKIGPSNLHGGDNISITTSGYDCFINLDLPSSLNVIDNLTTSVSGQGALDARQGKILKDSIPIVDNDISSTSTTHALSAYQGYVLNQKFNDYILKSGSTMSGNLIIDNNKGLTITGEGQGVTINGLQTITHWTNDSELAADKGAIFFRPEGHETQTNQTTVTSNDGGTVTSANITLQRKTNATVTYADKQNPRINFGNVDNSQAVSLIFNDYDSYLAPYGLTLVGNGQSDTNNGAYLKVEGNIHASNYYQNDYQCFGVKAWAYVTISGTTPTIVASGNISKVERTGTGAYRFTFSKAMPDKNFAAVASCEANNIGQEIVGVYSHSTTGVYIDMANHAGTAVDPTEINLIVVR